MLRRSMVLILFIGTLICSLKSQSTYTHTELYEDLQHVLDSSVNSIGVQGASATLILPDDSLWNGLYGIVTPGTNVTNDRRWHWASHAKNFIGMVVLELAENGDLDLDEAVGTYCSMSELPNVDSSLTLRSLLSHTTNLAEFWENGSPAWDLVWNDRDSVWGSRDLLAFIPSPVSNPNDEHLYTNTNFAVLGYMLEEVLGKPLPEIIDSVLIVPHGLNDTYFHGSTPFDMTSINGAWCGSSNRSSWSHTSYMTSRGTTGALVAPQEAITRHFRLHQSGNGILDSAMLVQVQTKAAGDPIIYPTVLGDVDIHYGLSTFIFEIDQSTLSDERSIVAFGHGGNGLNNAATAHVPDENITLSVVVNDFCADLGPVYYALLKWALDHPIDLFDETDPSNWPNGIEEVEDRVLVYPNPGSNKLIIEHPSIAKHEVMVSDVSGRVIFRTLPANGTLNLNAQAWRPGIYTIHFGDSGQSQVRWIKNKP